MTAYLHLQCCGPGPTKAAEHRLCHGCVGGAEQGGYNHCHTRKHRCQPMRPCLTRLRADADNKLTACTVPLEHGTRVKSKLPQRACFGGSAEAAELARGCKLSGWWARAGALCTPCGCVDCRRLTIAGALLNLLCDAPCCLAPKAACSGLQADSSGVLQRLASCAHAGMPMPAKSECEGGCDAVARNVSLMPNGLVHALRAETNLWTDSTVHVPSRQVTTCSQRRAQTRCHLRMILVPQAGAW